MAEVLKSVKKKDIKHNLVCGVFGDENGREKKAHRLVFGGITEGLTEEELEKYKALCLVALPEEEQKQKGLYAMMRPSPFPLDPFYSFFDTFPIGNLGQNLSLVFGDDDDDFDCNYDEEPKVGKSSIAFSHDGLRYWCPSSIDENKPPPFWFPPIEKHKPPPFWFPPIEKHKPPPFCPPPPITLENKAPLFVPLSFDRHSESCSFDFTPSSAVEMPTISPSCFYVESKTTGSSHNPYAPQGKRKNVPQETASFSAQGTRKKGRQEFSEASFGSFTGFSPFGWSNKAPGSVPIARSEDEHKPTGSSFVGSVQQHPIASPFARAKEENKAAKGKMDKGLADGEKCGCGAYLTPYCMCTYKLYRDIDSLMPLPEGASAYHLKLFAPIWRAYFIHWHQSHGFVIDNHPGFSRYGGANLTPLLPSVDFNSTVGVLRELASLAISEHNDKESNVFKYQLLKIEKVNFELYLDEYYSYYMTVKVLNLTLATPIETFEIHAGVKVHNDEKVIFCCRPKSEETIGLPSCDVCDRKLHRRVSGEELVQSFNSLSLSYWDEDHLIPRGASKEHLGAFRRIYERYDRQICQSDGFDFDVYPGDAKAAAYIPYLNFEREADMLRELANHAIQDYNNRETNDYTYTFSYIEKVNYLFAVRREFFMTVKVINSTLRTALETFQIHVYRGPREQNIVRLCRKKMLV